MPPMRAALLLATLLLGGCASSTTHQQLGAALNGLEGSCNGWKRSWQR